ncbi:MAG: trypsin-like peptidase domain-containing protein [Clostridium sp.]|nr:trypsin-like peptidase domain-containing protein [Clostridium sp.]
MQKYVVTLLSFLVLMGTNFQKADCSILDNMRYDEDSAITQIYEKMTPSIVLIEADLSDGLSTGTGCIIDSKGIILTSSHVVSGAPSVQVTISTGEVFKGDIISVMGKDNDLALIKINAKRQLPTIELGDSEKVKVGQRVLAIGNPFGFNGTLTTGIVSRIDYSKNKIQTDAAINPGNSGGPIINIRGEVIGISQSIYNPDNNISNIGIGFAVPINEAKNFIKLSMSNSKLSKSNAN